MTDSFESHIQHTFDSYCKKLLRNAAIDIRREYRRQSKREAPLSSLTTETLEKFVGLDEYSTDYDLFFVLGMEIIVKDPVLAQVLRELNEKRRTIILLYFYVGFTYRDISQTMGIAISTAKYQHKKAIEELQSKLKERKAW
ncbi:MAG: RNA polymerase sigma factor [Enterococcus sp.]